MTVRITPEQTQAGAELAAAAPGYRLDRDPADGWPMVPGRYGRLEHLGAGTFAAYTDRTKVRSRLLALPGVTLHQTGDRECRVLLAPGAVPAVAKLLRCSRKRRQTGGRPFTAAIHATRASNTPQEPRARQKSTPTLTHQETA